MHRPNPTTPPSTSVSSRERGSTLLLALFLIFILTMLGMGLLSRTLVVSRISGSERWSLKTFYAADSGLHGSLLRAQINNTQAFDFVLQDTRGGGNAGTIRVNADELQRIMPPLPVMGSQIGGGQGGSDVGLYVLPYKGRARADLAATRTQRTVSNIFTIGPIPLVILD